MIPIVPTSKGNLVRAAASRIIPEISWEYGHLSSSIGVEYEERTVILGGQEILIRCSNPVLYSLLEEKHRCVVGTMPNPSLFMFHDRPGPAVGIIDIDGRRAEVFGNGFGIFKSELHGFASRLMGMERFVPAHGAAICAPELPGTLMVTGNNGGKTTAIFGLTRLLKSGCLLGDDWVHIDLDKGSIGGFELGSIDQSVSVEKKTIEENCDLSWLHCERFAPAISRKMSIPVQDAFYGGFMPKPIRLSRIVLLTQGMTDLVTRINDPEAVAEYIIASTYHYPYLDEKEIITHRKVWEKAATECASYAYDWMHASTRTKGFTTLLQKLIESPCER